MFAIKEKKTNNIESTLQVVQRLHEDFGFHKMDEKSKNNGETTVPKDNFSECTMNSVTNVETRSKEGNPTLEKWRTEPCGLIILPITPTSFQASEVINFVSEKVTREYQEISQHLVKHRNVLVMQARLPTVGLLILQFLESVVKGTFQNLSSDSNSCTADSSMAIPCECGHKFLILENILRSGGFQFLTFRTCHGKAHLSTGRETKPVSIEEFNQLEVLVRKIGSFKDAISDLMSKLIGKNENDNTGRTTSSDVTQTDQTFLRDLNKLSSEHRESVRQLNAFKDKLCPSISSEKDEHNSKKSRNPNLDLHSNTQNGFDEHLDYERERERTSTNEPRARISGFWDRNIPVNRSYSLPESLLCISDRLLISDWINLRQFISPYLPKGVLESVRNGVKVFNELVSRNFISYENVDFIRTALFEIGRVDLVHLIDCIQEGDYSLLKERQTKEPTNGAQGTTVYNGLPVPPLRQMQNLTFENSTAVPRPPARLGSRSPVTATSMNTSGLLTRDNDSLQHKYTDLPQGSQTSTRFPIQENVSESAIVIATKDATAVSANHAATSREDTNTKVEYSAGDTDNRPDVQALGPGSDRSTGDQNSGEARTWIENPEVSCEHYDRYCDVQFSCCERFWPCHRCHNSESLCGTRKLRSRDIKKIKCKRCGKIQEFPKQTPNCVECNLKFANYFCAICQHLTGTQNHPFHCEKCGICRVHGERSFHCDTCGVCLDINLQGNHRCRVGSAHDECCICFEDAFTGCQILPCSHKVHKDCATLMLRNGVTKCPICRESFAHRLERRPMP